MPAPVVLRHVFRALRELRGEEDAGIRFTDGPPPVTYLDVFVYRPDDPAGVTSFATIGMAVAEMPDTPGPGGGGRAELYFTRRGHLERADEHAVAKQLANLAVYPWTTGEQLNWGHLVGLDNDFPTFPGCGAVFLAGPLEPAGPDYLRTESGPVRILNVVPVTDAERSRAGTMPPLAFVRELMALVDIYAAREA